MLDYDSLVEQCPFRGNIQDSGTPQESASCQLLAELTQVTDAELSRVSRATCSACCHETEPTPARMNVTIAREVRRIASEVIFRGGQGQCSPERAFQLHASARRVLQTAYPVDSARQLYLDDLQRIGDGRECRFLGLPLASPEVLDSPKYECHHPAHATTTLDACRLCSDWADRQALNIPKSLHDLIPGGRKRRGKRIRTWAVGVTTAPRRQETLDSCLDSVRRAGWDSPHVFMDRQVPLAARHRKLPVTVRAARLGAWPNFFVSLTELVMLQPDADAYLMVQDDALFYSTENLRIYLETVLWPFKRSGIASLYCSKAYAQSRDGWHKFKGQWVWGALAFVFSRKAAREFVADHEVFEHRFHDPHKGLAGVDVVVGRWAIRRGRVIAYPSPSLIQHLGEVSTIWPGADGRNARSAEHFVGDLRTSDGSTPSDTIGEPAESRRVDYRVKDPGRPRVSVITVYRNDRDELRETVAQIQQQSFHDFELILVDFGSRDGTRRVAQELASLDPRIRLLTGIPRRRSLALNLGIRHALAPYVTRADVGDVPAANRLEELVRCLDVHSDVVAVGSPAGLVNAQGVSLGQLDPPLLDAEIRSAIRNRQLGLLGNTAMTRTSAAMIVADSGEEDPVAEDLDRITRLADLGRLMNTPTALVTSRVDLQQADQRDIALTATQVNRVIRKTSERRARVAIEAELVEREMAEIGQRPVKAHSKVFPLSETERAAMEHDSTEMLSICVTLQNRSWVRHDAEILPLFPRCVDSLSLALAVSGLRVELIVTDFRSDDWAPANWLPTQLPNESYVRRIDVAGAFNRGRGLNLAAEHAGSPFLFFLDADMLISAPLLQSIRHHLSHQRVVFPMCLRQPASVDERATWAVAGYGNLAVRAADFWRMGPWEEKETWGGEDTRLFEAFRRRLPVVRLADPTFVHQWHPRRLGWNTTPDASL